jgi:methylase of polypeptide subunit release factors
MMRSLWFERTIMSCPLFHRPTDVDHIDRNRRALFAAVGVVLQRFSDSESEAHDWRERSLVWSHGTLLGDPVIAIAPDGGHLRVEWPKGLVASIVVRVGECRIGLLIPRNQVADPSVFSEFLPYPSGVSGAGCPARIVRNLGDAYSLVDFVFSGCRLGDPGLTRDALRGRSAEIALLADGLAQETMHLSSALVHHLAMTGIYFGDGAAADQEPYVFSTAHADVARALNLTPAQLSLVGDGEIPGTRKWMALIPPGRADDFETRLQSLCHLEFLDRQRLDELCDVDGLSIHASPGVYHPGPGSSTLFLLEALAQDGAFRGAGDPLRVLDLGCGSGALALWLQRRFPRFTVMGSDVDARAVRDATDNARRNNLVVPFVEADLLSEIPNHGPWREPFDRIVWNYPFWQAGGVGETDFEHIAIDENGLLLRRLFTQLPPRLRAPSGLLYLSYSTLASQDLLAQLVRDAGMALSLIAQDASSNGYQRQVWRIARAA